MFALGTMEDAIDSGFIDGIDISYRELVEKLGEPNSKGWCRAVMAEWILKFEDGTIATIYNYFTGYPHERKLYDVTQETSWHVGGHDEKGKQAVELVKELLDI